MGIFGNLRGQARYSGELHNLQITESVYATTVPIIIGTARVHSKLLFYGGFKAVTAPSAGKGFGGGKAQQFEYYADVIAMLGSASNSAAPAGILNVWDQNGKLANLSGTFNYTIPSGGGAYQPTGNNPPIQQELGVTQALPYSVVANDYGAGGAKTLTGTQQVPMKLVTGTPAGGQYAFDAATSTYTFAAADAGRAVALTYSCVFSLFYFEETQAAQIPTNSPYQVSTNNQAYFQADQGVVFVDTGVALTAVGGTPSTGQYHEGDGYYTFAAADAGRYVYIKYEYFSSDQNLSNSSALNLTFFNGAPGQAPWSYMASKYPGDAFGYSGVCYIGANPMALGESATLPSYNYEVVGLCRVSGSLDADVTYAIVMVLSDPLCGVEFPLSMIGDLSLAQNYWGANGYFISHCLNSASPAASTIQQWIEAGNTAAFFSDGYLKLVPYGDTTAVGNGSTYTPPTKPVATLTWDDILPMQDQKPGSTGKDDPIQFERKQPQDRYNYMQAQWSNRENDYNNELTLAHSDAFIQQYGRRIEPSQTWNFITEQAVATWALQLRLNRSLYIPETGKLRLPFTFSYLEPMDMLVLPTGEAVRITQVDEDEHRALTISFENFSYGSADVTVYTKQPSNSYQPNVSQALPGNAVPVFVQQTVRQANNLTCQLTIAASGTNPNWGGCNIYVSLDGQTYTRIGIITSPGIVGLLTAALPSSVDPDTTDTLSVDLTLSPVGAELITATQEAADQYATLCAIVDAGNESMELLSYETATMTQQGRYSLNYLRRGAFGTVIAPHAAGAWFSFIGLNDFFTYSLHPQNVGQIIYIKLQSFNLTGGQLQNLAQCKAWEVFATLQGTVLNMIGTYRPTTFSDTGTVPTVDPSYAYDDNLSTAALVSAGGLSVSNGICIWSGFLNQDVGGASLFVNCLGQIGAYPGLSLALQYSLDGGTTWITLEQFSSGNVPRQSTLNVSLPSGQNAQLVQVKAIASKSHAGSGPEACNLSVYEIWIQ